MPSIDLKSYQQKKPTKPVGNAEVAASSKLLTLLNTDISFSKGGLNDKKKEYLYLELSSMLEAGVNLKESFELVTDDQRKEKDKILYQTILQSILAGSTFSDALQQTGKFSLYEVYSLKIGEETGKLIEVLKDLAKYYQNKIKQRRKIVSALTYPCVVMCTSLAAVFFMLKFVVPMFGDVFKRFGGHLPWITEKIITISEALSSYFWFFMVFVIGVMIFIIAVKETEQFKKTMAAIVLKIPVVGNLVQKIYLARLCNAMQLLISARLPLLRTISLVSQMIGYYPVSSSLKKIENSIMEGKLLYQSMQEFDIYPSKMIQLVKVGEETNRLDYFFNKIAEQYVEEVEFKTATISSVMEPLIIVFLGLIVGVILISMYLPLFQMSNSFQ